MSNDESMVTWKVSNLLWHAMEHWLPVALQAIAAASVYPPRVASKPWTDLFISECQIKSMYFAALKC